MKFVIEDRAHGNCKSYPTFDEALAELLSRSKINWDEEPNKCPCKSWRTCERRYHILEMDDSVKPPRLISDMKIFTISFRGIQWHTTIIN
ncbi:MAG: hypothetical protein KA099_08875 [Alphaproteobacteria bacterium]|nr:hypothetical protein [Alphaproteobacteria bacterium]MBP7758428.1 hypothetical protein [Alphaproteobacteria bacterium]MBP7762423.1 hypothetical protein [Alphaproteobacteria bacterium]MBP7905423.1 hypothetical protein [Alphaproteobacteria bacterium]